VNGFHGPSSFGPSSLDHQASAAASVLAAEARPFPAGSRSPRPSEPILPRRRNLGLPFKRFASSSFGSRPPPERGCRIYRPDAGKDELAGMNTTLSWRLPTRDFRVAALRSTRISVAASFGR